MRNTPDRSLPAARPPRGPRPRLRPSWADQQRQRRKQRFQRLLDGSFRFRLLIAIGAAILLLGMVNRWEQCRHDGFATGCFLSDPGGILNVGNVEALSIVSAALLFILEGQQRRRRDHLQAMEVILACQQCGAHLSHARNEALEKLCESGIWLDGLDLSEAELEELHAPHARLRRVNLRGANLRRAYLRDADLQGSDLSGADLSEACLVHADLRGVNLKGAILTDADLTGADRDHAAESDHREADPMAADRSDPQTPG